MLLHAHVQLGKLEIEPKHFQGKEGWANDSVAYPSRQFLVIKIFKKNHPD